MSNRVSVERTVFSNLEGTESTFGYRIYDNYGSVYNNNFQTREELELELNSENFWKILEAHEEFEDVDPMEEGMEFDGDWFDGEEIKELAEEVERRTAKRIED